MAGRSPAAKRYAEAVASIASQAGTWDAWLRDLTQVADALAEPVIRAILANPNQTVNISHFLDSRSMRDGLRPETIRLLRVMASKRTLGLLPDAVEWLHELADRARGVRRVEVTSAVPLDASQQRQVQMHLADVGGDPANVALTLQVDPGIIGGLVIREGDHIKDRSVRARLETLRERMA
jgi:F-type H+-transporting ATPase subunit delta